MNLYVNRMLGLEAIRRLIRSRRSCDTRRRNRHGGNKCTSLPVTEALENRTLLTIDTLSVAVDGTTGDGLSNDPHLSRDGRFVAFQSRADDLDLVSGSDANGYQDIFVRNLEDGTTTLISINPLGRSGDDDSWSPTISDDGRFVAFAGFTTDLVRDTTITDGPNVFVHDRDTDGNGIYDESGGTVTRLLSRDAADPLLSGNAPSGGISLGPSWPLRPRDQRRWALCCLRQFGHQSDCDG